MTSSRYRRAGRLGVVLFIVGVLWTFAAPAGASGGSGATVIQDNLSSPKGLTTLFGIAPVVGQGAFGPPGPVVLSVKPGKTVPLTAPAGCVDIAVTTDFAIWCLSSENGKLYRQGFHGGFKEVANIPLYQHSDPDPVDQDDFPEESNPYGLTAFGKSVLVADAAANDVLRIDRWGNTVTVARFGLEPVSTSHLPPDQFPGLPPVITAEAVPTSIAVYGNSIYVGELKGFPFRPGSSNIYKIDANAVGADCSTTPNSTCRVWKTGFTSIQDIAIDKWTGKLYVYELAKDGTFAFEEGLETGNFPPAVLLEVKGSSVKELAAGQLSQPGGVTASFGKVYVTDNVFTGGRLLKIG